jgi:hypothetical protein
MSEYQMFTGGLKMSKKEIDVNIYGEQERVWERAKLISSQAIQEAKDSILFNEAILEMAESKIKELGT